MPNICLQSRDVTAPPLSRPKKRFNQLGNDARSSAGRPTTPVSQRECGLKIPFCTL